MELKADYYTAKPTCCGLITTKNGFDQFAFEVAIKLTDEATGETETKYMTKFSGLDGQGLEYVMQDAETCGCNTSQDIREWMVDPKRSIRVKLEVDGEYGLKLKSIFPMDGGGGAIIKKQAMGEARKAAVAESVNARIAALRAKAGKGSGSAIGTPDDSDIPF